MVKPSVTSAADTPVASTNLKSNLRNTEGSLRDWIQLQGVNVLLVSTRKPDLCEYGAIIDIISVDPLIRGEYPFNNSSSLWRDERRESVYAKVISWVGWEVAKRRTVVLAEKFNSRDQRYL